MNVIERINLLKKMVKEAEKLVTWQADIFAALHNIHADWIVIGTIAWARLVANFPRTIAELLSDHNLAHHGLGIVVPHDALANLTEKAHGSLTGVTSDQHHARDHHTRHEPGGADEVTGVAPGAHAASHQDGGADEVSVAGLSGELADNQPPKAHKDSHDPEDGSDPLDTAVPVKVGAANAEGSSHSLARADHVHEREHAKTALFSELTDRWTLAQAHRGADGKIMVFKGPAADPVEEDKPVAKLKAGTVTETTTAGGLISVNFAEAFASTPVVIVQLEGDVDYYPVVTAKSTTGFTVKILKTAHKHSQGATGGESSHTHDISLTSGAGSAHKHSVPNTSAVSAGTPSGSISSKSAGTPDGDVGAEKAHIHGMSFGSGVGGSHKHTIGSTGTPSATHSAISGITRGTCGTGHANCVVTDYATRYYAESFHTHTNPDTGLEPSHFHTVSGTSGPGSSHSHSFSGDALPTHNHTFTGSALGTHSHTVGDTGNESAHTHSISGASGAGSSHSHSNPDTAEVSAGNTLANTEVTFSYIAMVP